MDRCENLMKYLAAYADGELEGGFCERVEKHLAECERCRRECADLKKVAELYRNSPAPEVGEADWARVSAALERCLEGPAAHIDDIRQKAGRRHRFGWWLMPAAGLAAAVLIVALFVGPTPEHPDVPNAQILGIETDPDYEPIVRLPADDDDFLIIDVYHVE